MRDFQDTTTTTLKSLLPGVGADAKALFKSNKEEAMNLFRLYKRIATEIRYRSFHFASVSHQFN